MKYGKVIILLLCFNLFTALLVTAQDDDVQQEVTLDNIEEVAEEEKSEMSGGNIEEIIVTATKGETSINKTTVPVQQIIQKYLKASGTVKLSQILQEQTGIQLTNFLGTGVQLQGLSAEYTLILINGEPIIGKNAGVIDLSRIIVSNIKKVEIIKGPVSCLYGSDALGGVINVITEDIGIKKSSSLEYAFQYKTPVQIANNLNGTFVRKKLTIENNINHNFSNGFQTNKETIYKEGAPYQDFTINNKLTYRANNKIHFGTALKYYHSKLHNKNVYSDTAIGNYIATQKDKINEINVNPFFKFISNKNIVLNIRNYNSLYKYKSHFEGEAMDNELYDDNYKQLLTKVEAQLDYRKNKHLLTTGAGGFYNLINTKRNEGQVTQHQEYIFLQYQYELNNKFIINVGNRTDFPNDFEIQWFSPKVSARYNANKYFYVKASGGRGYRAPEIRQQYLNFTNAMAGNYSVFGTNVALQQLDLLVEQGRIIYKPSFDRNTLQKLVPESSWAFNGEIGISPIPNKLSFSANYFRNEISNLIDNVSVADKIDEKGNVVGIIYTYFNLKKIYTQGIESEFNYNIIKGLSLNAGYQFLVAKDKEIVKNIEAGKAFKRNPETMEDERMTKKDYYGLNDRSKHSFNVKLYYENQKHDFNTYIRIIYRGKYGLDKITYADSQFIPGQTNINFSFTKHIKKRYSVMFGMENYIQKKSPLFTPFINKVTAYVGFSVNLLNK